MSLGDPQSIDIGAGAVSLPRTSTGSNTSTYTSADGNVQVVISHNYAKRTRRSIRVNVRKTAADPLFPAQNAPYSMSAFLNVDVPAVGFTAAEAKSISKGLITLLTASSDAVLTKFTQGES